MTLSASQIAIRSSGIGSSEIGAICGISFWKRAADGSPAGGPHSVYLAKRGLIASSPKSNASEAGDDAEFLAERRYERDTGLKLAPLLDEKGDPITMRHPDHPWVLASIDRVRVADWIPVEVKAMFGLRAHYHEGRDRNMCAYCDRPLSLHWREPSQDPAGIPDDVMCQVQWQMFVCGAPFAEVARFWVDWNGLQFSRYRVPRNEKIIAYLFEEGRKFWFNHMIPGIPPEPDPSIDSEKCERTFSPNVLRKVVQAPAGTEQHVNAFLESSAIIDEAKKKHLESANWLRRIVGDAEGLTGDGFVVTNRSRTDGVRALKVRKL